MPLDSPNDYLWDLVKVVYTRQPNITPRNAVLQAFMFILEEECNWQPGPILNQALFVYDILYK